MRQRHKLVALNSCLGLGGWTQSESQGHQSWRAWGPHSVVFLYFFVLVAEEGLLISSCYSLELCIQMLISPFLLCFSLLFFSQLFVRPPQTAILLFCTSCSGGLRPLVELCVEPAGLCGRRGSQGASRAAPGKSGLHARGEGPEGSKAARASPGSPLCRQPYSGAAWRSPACETCLTRVV